MPFTRPTLARIITERLREHTVQAKFLGVTKLFNAECHCFVTGFGLGRYVPKSLSHHGKLKPKLLSVSRRTIE